VLDTDVQEFGGHNRNQPVEIFSKKQPYDGVEHTIQIYLPSRSALVLQMVQ